MEIEAGIALENEEAVGTQREGEEAPCQEKSAWCLDISLLTGDQQESSGTVMGSPTRGGAALAAAEREEDRLTRGREACFKELEFCHLFTHLTTMCQRVQSPSY